MDGPNINLKLLEKIIEEQTSNEFYRLISIRSFLFNDIFSLLQQILQTAVKPDLMINSKDFSDLIKLDLDKKNAFMKLKDMFVGFSTISTITKLKGTDQINNAQISSFCNGVIQVV